jgi:cytokinin dehydrogenase
MTPSRRTVLSAGLGLGVELAATVVGATPAEPDDFSRDFGRLIARVPKTVLRPVSAAEVADILRSADRQGLKVAARGQGHSTYGRSLVEDGVVVDMSALGAIGPVGPDRITVGAGATWAAVLDATLEQGLTPPVLTNYLGLSVGGTLAIGGIGGSSSRYGLQTDQVLELEVVTGRGQPLACSPTVHRDLFNAVRAGLGKCGIVTRATLSLVRAPRRVRRFQLFYRDAAALAADQRLVLADERFDQLQGAVLPAPTGGWRYQLEGALFHDGDLDADGRRVLDGLSDDREAAVLTDASWRDDALAFAKLRQLLTSNGQWFHPQPWLLGFVRGSNAESVLREVMDGLTAADIGPFGRITFYPLATAAMRTPLARLPDEAQVFVLNLIRIPASNDRAMAERMVAHNRQLYERLRNAGGTLYPVSALPMSPDDWQRHFGAAWPAFHQAMQHCDPSGILAPGYPLSTHT